MWEDLRRRPPMIMMKIVLFLLSLLETGLGQTGERRVCGLQMVVDNLVWTNTRLAVVARHNLTGHSHQEISRVTRFEIKSLLSRLVNRANTVLLSQQFNNIHYRLALQDIQVGTRHITDITQHHITMYHKYFLDFGGGVLHLQGEVSV